MLQKNIAAIVTTYFSESHADLLLSNFVDESLINSNYQATQVRIASLYIDQIHWSDIGINIAKKYLKFFINSNRYIKNIITISTGERVQ